MMKYPLIERREVMLVNPYTGQARDIRDVNSDPYGFLVVDPSNHLMACKGDENSVETDKYE